MVIFNSYVKLPEGMIPVCSCLLHILRNIDSRGHWPCSDHLKSRVLPMGFENPMSCRWCHVHMLTMFCVHIDVLRYVEMVGDVGAI